MSTVRHAVVVGAGMAGLLAARALAETFGRVTVLDRDELPGDARPRRGVPQGRHVHGLQPRGLLLLNELFDGIGTELVAAGAVRGPMRFHLSGHRLARPGTGRPGLFASRPLLEGRVRARVAAQPAVALLPGRAVTGLVVRAGRVTGVDTGAGTLHADLVVDAMGRGSRTPTWLDGLGRPGPAEDRIEVGLRYATRTYRLAPGALGRDVAVLTAATPACPRGALLAAVEGGRHLLTATGVGPCAPPTDAEGFVEHLSRLVAPDIADALVGAEPLDDPVGFRFPASVRRRYERVDSFPTGLLVIGDGICSFNPVYGQGMSVAVMQAAALRTATAGGEVPDARRWFRAASALVDGPWTVSAGSDLAFPHAVGRRGPAVRVLNAWLPRLHAAAAHDPLLAEAVLRVTGLLDPPRALLRPDRIARVLLDRGRRRPCGSDTGPARPRGGAIPLVTAARPAAPMASSARLTHVARTGPTSQA